MLSFSNSKFVMPIVLVYDAEERKYLDKLTIRFQNDEYEPVKLSFNTKCKSSINILTSLTSFRYRFGEVWSLSIRIRVQMESSSRGGFSIGNQSYVCTNNIICHVNYMCVNLQKWRQWDKEAY